jgi:hypothetical protein
MPVFVKEAFSREEIWRELPGYEKLILLPSIAEPRGKLIRQQPRKP